MLAQRSALLPINSRDMRLDSLAQMLNHANIHSGSRVLVVDDCLGLLVAACLERLGGTLVNKARH